MTAAFSHTFLSSSWRHFLSPSALLFVAKEQYNTWEPLNVQEWEREMSLWNTVFDNKTAMKRGWTARCYEAPWRGGCTKSHMSLEERMFSGMYLGICYWTKLGSTCLAPCNKLCTFLPHYAVSVDWLHCVCASGPEFCSKMSAFAFSLTHSESQFPYNAGQGSELKWLILPHFSLSLYS